MIDEKTLLRNMREIISLLRKIQRPGINELISFLVKNQFFYVSFNDINDSGMQHAGAVADHSLGVYNTLLKLNQVFDIQLNEESMIIVGLLHDICRIDSNNNFHVGHSEKSIYIIQRYIQLTDDEIIAINSHMGYADDRCHSYNEFLKAYDISPLALFLFVADNIQASYLAK